MFGDGCKSAGRLARLSIIFLISFLAGYGCAKNSNNDISGQVEAKRGSANIDKMDTIRRDLAFNYGVIISFLAAKPTHDLAEIADLSLTDLLAIRTSLDSYIDLSQDTLAVAARKDVKSSDDDRSMIGNGLTDCLEWRRVVSERIINLQSFKDSELMSEQAAEIQTGATSQIQ